MANQLLKTIRDLVRELGLRTVTSATQYNLTVRAKNRRFARPKPRGPFQTLSDVTAVHRQPGGAVIHTERGAVEIQFITPEMVRVRLRPDGTFAPPFSYAVEKTDWPLVAVTDNDLRDSFSLQSDRLVCQVQKKPFRLVIKTIDGQVISEDQADGLAWRESEICWTRNLPPGESCYGLGQRASSLNLRGKRLTLWNIDPILYERGADPVYLSIPFYLGLRSDLAYGILWDNPARGNVDLGQSNAKQMSFSAEDGELRFYLMAGPNAEAVLKHYTDLTGHMPLPPMWALGFHQSRWGYTEADFERLMREFRQRRLPCDALYFDIDYMHGYRCFTWDQVGFARLPELIGEMAKHGFKAVAILDPGIKIDPGYAVYQSGVSADIFLKYPDGSRVAAPVWPGASHFPDFTGPRARSWWADQLAALGELGFSGIWNDMNEPALITMRADNTLPDYIVHDWEGVGQTHSGGGHNVYGMLMARATREGLEKLRPGKRQFVITRAAHAGAQRYTSSWTGDNVSTWDHLRLSVSMVLNMGLSGLAFTGPDVGGFGDDSEAELFTRWMQLGSMLPFFRVHTSAGTAPQEPWSYGARYETIIRHYLEQRYQLLPYIYSVFARCAHEGMPVVRPLFLTDPSDDHLRGLDDEFMLGDSLLVAPVLGPGVMKRQVYLPRGVWYEFDTGRLIDGAQEITVDAPLERMPVYVRAGKVLPMWPVRQYVGENPLDEGRLRVYAGSGDTTIYEDAGEGLTYQDGDYRWSYFACKFLPSGQFAIDWRRAGKYQPPYARVRVEVAGISGEPESVELDGQAAPVWYYENGIVEFSVTLFGEARIIGRSYTGSPAQATLPHPPG